MRGAGLLERCQEATKLKPLNVVQLYFFHLEIDVEFNTVNIKCEFSRHIREGIWIKSFDHCSWQHCFQSWVDRGTVGVTFPQIKLIGQAHHFLFQPWLITIDLFTIITAP